MKAYGSAEWFIQEYANVAGDPWGLSWRPSQVLRYQKTLALLAAIPQQRFRVMDIGCATGDFTYLLSRYMTSGEALLGVDFVESAVMRARQRFSHINFIKESVFSLGDTYKGQFDLVACLEVLYYLDKEDQSRALQSIKGVLRNKGYAIFSSVISPPPYFTPDQLLNLVGSEFEIISFQILHLKVASFLEMIARRMDKLVYLLSRGKLNGFSANMLCQVPFSAVIALERWSRVFKKYSASHTIVLARARSL